MHDVLPPLTEFLHQFATPGFVCVMRGLPPTPPVTYAGVEGVAAAWSDYGGVFERVRVRRLAVHESSDHLVMTVDQVATTTHGGVEIAQPSAMLFAFTGDRVARVEFHLDQAEALRVAGIET